jgi:formate hydrogenlyase subunit 4
VFLGLFPTLFLKLLDPLTQQLTGRQLSAQLTVANGLVLSGVTPQGGTVSTLGIVLMLLCLLPVPWALWLFFARGARTRIGPTWACGQPGLTPQMEYTATGFSKPIRMIFKALFRPRREVQRDYDFSPYFATNVRFAARLAAAARAASGQPSGLFDLHLRHLALAAALCLMKLNFMAIVSQTALLLLLAPLVSGCVKNWKARLQNRRGPRPWQPYFDLAKFLRKDMVISDHASWVFSFAPYVVFLTALSVGLMTPMLTAQAPLSLFGGVLAVVGLLALGRFFLALGGLDPGSAFGGMGSSREMTIAAIAEPAMMLAIFTVAITAGSTDLSRIVQTMQGPTWKLLNPTHVMAFAALFIVLIAETGRIPVDNPATHLELTMIHEAMLLEYSGRYLALMEWGASIKQLVLMTLLVDAFFPLGIATDATPAALGVSLLAYGAKLLAISAAVVLVETTNAKLRLFRVPDLLSTAFVLATLALLSTFLFN